MKKSSLKISKNEEISYIIPQKDIQKLEEARLVLWKLIESDVLGINQVLYISQAICNLTHKKYLQNKN
jgi:hypothetical protein